MNILAVIPITTFGLGIWQLKRLNWKLELINGLENSVPIDLQLNLKEFTKVKVNGTLTDDEIRIPRPKNINGRVQNGFLLFNGLDTEKGRIIVNRGWIPLQYAETKPKKLEIEGIIRKGESSFMLSNEPSKNDWKSINVEQFAKKLNSNELLVEITKDGSEYPLKRSVEMPNNHLMYAITWFGLSLTTLMMMRRKKSNKLFKF